MVSKETFPSSMPIVLFVCSAVSILLAYVIPVDTFVVSFNKILWHTFYNDYLAFVGLLLFVAGLLCTKQKLYVTPVAMVLLLIACIPLLQWVLGVIFFWGDAFVAFAYVAGAGLAFFCGTNSVFQGQRQRILFSFAVLFLLLGLISFYMSLYQFFQLDYGNGLIYQNTDGARIFGNLRQPNNFSSLLMMSLLFVWYLFEKKCYSRTIWLLLTLCMVTAIVLVQSRTSILVMVLVFFFFLFSRRKIQFRASIVDIVMIIVAYSVLRIAFQALGDAVFTKELVGVAKNVYAFSDSSRLLIWYEALKAIVDGPFWGYGWNQVGLAQVLLDSDLTKVLHFRQSHNLFLDIILWNGPAIGLSLIFALIVFIWRSACDCRSVEDWILLVVVGALFTHAMVEYPLHYAHFLLPIVFLIGLFDKKGAHAKGVISVSPVLICGVTMFATFLLITVVNDFGVIEKKTQTAHTDLRQYDIRIKTHKTLDDIVLLTQLRELLKFSKEEITLGVSEDDIIRFKKVSHRFPSPLALSYYAKACYVNGQQGEASRVLNVIRRLFGEDEYLYAKLFVYGEKISNKK
ncbi:MAG: O-antigen ligase [Candidatus Endobugula sp.]|jgi:O-antigen ligase